MYIPTNEVRSHSDFLDRRWESTLAITGIQKHHVFQCAGMNELFIGHYASYLPRQKIRISQYSPERVNLQHRENISETMSGSAALDVRVGEWVLVRYDGSLFPGEVKGIGEQEINVSVMVPSGSHFKWPAIEDSIFYQMTDVIKKLSPPVLKSARGTFEFLEVW